MTKDYHTAEELFPWAFEGPTNPGYLYECGLCGAAISNMDTHVDWHNSLRK